MSAYNAQQWARVQAGLQWQPPPPCRCDRLDGFSDDARTAMQASPDYFIKWYTIKSIGLGVVAAALAFMIGRASKR